MNAGPGGGTCAVDVGEWLCLTLAVLLHRGTVGPDEDFFTLGGHSLTAVELLDRVEREFGVGIGLRDFYTDPTARALAGRVAGARPASHHRAGE